MDPSEKETILTVALMASFADGFKNDSERPELKSIAQSLPRHGVHAAAL